jgi:GTP-binding protein HflX
MTEIFGNTTGLSPSALRALERVYRRRVPLDKIATLELCRSLAEASRESRRQVGALVHRMGTVDTVIVGGPTGLLLPDIGRLRAAQGRFRALRLVHTHLFNETLTRDDLTDLTRLRLDLVAALLLGPDGEPKSMTWAHSVPVFEPHAQSYVVVDPVPYGQPQPDFGGLISSLEAEFARYSRTRAVRGKDGRAILVHVGEKGPGSTRRAESRLAELGRLAETAGVEVADQVIQLRDRVDSRFVVGRGRLEQVVIRAIELGAETLVFDCNLTPAQVAGIATRTDLRVVDRTQLILDIFAQRAQTRDGKLQVELAQLRYTLPKLGLRDDALSRLTGGIGGRGPGETKLEIGRRRARERLSRLERELEVVGKQRAQRRARRGRREATVVAMVGYTNAGKSTLLNTLTEASVLAEDRLFATLDTRARRLRLPDGTAVVLTDTVGFIREMPTELFAAFRATFEEASEADLLLEIVDASDAEYADHLKTTERVLGELGLTAIPRLRVYNKVDRIACVDREALEREADAVCVCALERVATDGLLQRIAGLLAGPSRLPADVVQDVDANDLDSATP